ncbi:hypothetical protein [Sphingobacterium thalpophilum]|uniref:hypothetical protein n=1 Tax=Sphingobacterium thalpophilum TaxID=259 RepID=UPI0024A6FACC|nr:hypothetical protein [Sphingobacterium thalpophilum]
MKRVLLLLTCCHLAYFTAHAQSKPGRKYLNLGYVSEHLKTAEDIEGDSKIKSKFGASLSSGRTFFLNQAPIAKVLYFGIDWTYLDLNYAQFKETDTYSFEDQNGATVTESEDYISHKAEIGMQVGPSVHIGLTDGFSVSGHVRYAPSYSLLYADEDFSGGFGNFFTAGLSANYGAFGVGFETRWGSSKHSFNIAIDDLEEQEITVKEKIKLSGSRVFLAFRF